MILIVCISKKMGLTFNNRRVSRDKAVIQDIVKHANGQKVHASPYSKVLFDDISENIEISTNYLRNANDGEFVFFEQGSVQSIIPKVDTIIVYNWNRDYPADETFTIPSGFYKVSEEHLTGNSHDIIIKTIYGRS